MLPRLVEAGALGPGHPFTSFSSERIEYYGLSPEGDNLLLSRYHTDSDIVLLRDTSAQRWRAELLARWKEADPDIPILKEAKAEYAKLQ